MRSLKVELGPDSYPIRIGEGLAFCPDAYRDVLSGGRVMVVSNETVAPLYLDALTKTLASLGCEPVSCVLPDGEVFKNWETLNRIFDALLEHACERSTPLLALGGGVVGDMTGFAAACYQRGVPFIQVPTTLLAQVDSSVGGKTGINHPRGKNMIGAFHQPRLVVCDPGVFKTLPDREFAAGLAEVVKYGLIADVDFFEWIEANGSRIWARESECLGQMIERCCAIKANVVAADEREQGVRAHLNLGHTFGHAIESETGYGQWLHGEAVAVGTLMALTLSASLGYVEAGLVTRVAQLFQGFSLPVLGPGIPLERFWAAMGHDKKVSGGKIRFVVLKALGVAELVKGVDREQVLGAVAAHLSPGSSINH